MSPDSRPRTYELLPSGLEGETGTVLYRCPLSSCTFRTELHADAEALGQGVNVHLFSTGPVPEHLRGVSLAMAAHLDEHGPDEFMEGYAAMEAEYEEAMGHVNDDAGRAWRIVRSTQEGLQAARDELAGTRLALSEAQGVAGRVKAHLDAFDAGEDPYVMEDAFQVLKADIRTAVGYGPTCPAVCDPDCGEPCHEAHQVASHQSHDPQACGQAVEAARGTERVLEAAAKLAQGVPAYDVADDLASPQLSMWETAAELERMRTAVARTRHYVTHNADSGTQVSERVRELLAEGVAQFTWYDCPGEGNGCTCPCEGCTHHCGAHGPAEARWCESCQVYVPLRCVLADHAALDCPERARLAAEG